MPVIGAVIGIFVGKWIGQRNENKKLKRQVYLKANQALNRYKDIYMVAPLNLQENMQRLHEQQMLLETAKADLEIFGSDQAVALYGKCLEFTVRCGSEALERIQKGQIPTNLSRDLPSQKDFLESWANWNKVVRKDLNLIRKKIEVNFLQFKKKNQGHLIFSAEVFRQKSKN